MASSRRKFLKRASLAGVGLGMAPMLSAFPKARANDHITVAIMGVRSRGRHLAQVFAAQPNARVAYVCDVDQRYLDRCVEEVTNVQDKAPKGEKDIRRVVEDPELDAVVIAAPDHWHTPAALLALAAGKHVYVEKPCSHNPREGEMLVEAQQKTGLVVQMGNQRRSYPNVRACMERLHGGLIGKVYHAKAWYANRRESIGHGQETSVPDYLDFELWQGPAPRTVYRDNIHPYNWHWFKRWGTGEALNNGTHEVDLARWGLQEEYPEQVSASGGRYHYDDDWEFPDTLTFSCTYANGKMLSWEGRSRQPYPIHGHSRGNMFHGTEGSCLLTGNDYVFYNLDGEVIAESKDEEVAASDATNTVSPAAGLDGIHVANFLEGIRSGATLASPIEQGHRSVLTCQLGNIAWSSGQTLHLNTSTGRLQNGGAAEKLWSRDYAPGWEPEV